MSNLHDTPGYQRFLREVIATVENRGRWPSSKTISGLTPQERADLLLAIRADCLTLDEDETKVKVDLDRMLRLDFRADRVAMETAFTARARRPIRPLRASHAADHQQAMTWLRARPTRAAAYLRTQLEENTGWLCASLRQGGLSQALRDAENFLAVADRLPVDPPRRFRTLAKETGLPSKALDSGTPLYRRVTNYLTRIDLPDGALDEDDEAVWRAAGITRNMTAIHVLIHGPLLLDVGGTIVTPQLEPPQSHLLTWELVEAAQIRGQPPGRALFIENETSFAEARSHAPTDTILVFTEGYPNRAVLRLARMLATAGAACFHWGDIDAGGFRTLRGLRTAAQVCAVLMDTKALNTHTREPLDERKAVAIEQELAYWPAGFERETLMECLRLKEWLEQESIPPAEAFKLISEAR